MIAYHTIYHTNLKGVHKIIQEIERVIKHNGEVFLTLLSKEDDFYKSEFLNQSSKNTIIKIEEGMKIPHLFLDKDEIFDLFSRFQIIEIRHIYEYRKGKNPCHYHLYLKNIKQIMR
jgi:ubiquinone/menaquinone biosynthesis C-methylase UbiE